MLYTEFPPDEIVLTRAHPLPALPPGSLVLAPQTARVLPPNPLRPPLLPNPHHPRTTPLALPRNRFLTRHSPQMRLHRLRSRQQLHNSMARERPWHALQAQAFQMTNSSDPGQRESARLVCLGDVRIWCWICSRRRWWCLEGGCRICRVLM